MIIGPASGLRTLRSVLEPDDLDFVLQRAAALSPGAGQFGTPDHSPGQAPDQTPQPAQTRPPKLFPDQRPRRDLKPPPKPPPKPVPRVPDWPPPPRGRIDTPGGMALWGRPMPLPEFRERVQRIHPEAPELEDLLDAINKHGIDIGRFLHEQAGMPSDEAERQGFADARDHGARPNDFPQGWQLDPHWLSIPYPQHWSQERIDWFERSMDTFRQLMESERIGRDGKAAIRELLRREPEVERPRAPGEPFPFKGPLPAPGQRWRGSQALDALKLALARRQQQRRQRARS